MRKVFNNTTKVTKGAPQSKHKETFKLKKFQFHEEVSAYYCVISIVLKFDKNRK